MSRVRLRVDQLDRDPARFQVRESAYAETIAASIARIGWNEAKAGLIHVWPEESEDGVRYWVLDGHSRLAGILRLDVEQRPECVECELHDTLTMHEAIQLAQEFNASARALRPAEQARLTRKALEECGSMAHVAVRFPGHTARELSRDLPLAWLPKSVAQLVDDGDMPVQAGRALGDFIRTSGIESDAGWDLARNFMLSGMQVGEFQRYLRENADSVRVASQSDMFGVFVTAQMQAAARIREDVKATERLLAEVRARRVAFASLEGTPAAATAAQRSILETDAKRERGLVAELNEKQERLRRAIQFGASVAGGGS